jgi:hypothetical protein
MMYVRADDNMNPVQLMNEAQLRKQFQLPDDLSSIDLKTYGIWETEFAEPPKPEPLHKVGMRVEWDGEKFIRIYFQQARTQEELETRWKEVRRARNRFIRSCDWTQLPDAQLNKEQKKKWVKYRQELRDVTKATDPFQIHWPKLELNDA